MENAFGRFVKQQRLERQRELHHLEQSSLAVQFGSENVALTRMLDRHLNQSEECGTSHSPKLNDTEQETTDLDKFFEVQRAQRLDEVASISNQSNASVQRRSMLGQMLQRMLQRSSEEENEPNSTTNDELHAIENAQRVSTLLSDTFRSRLEEALSRRPEPVGLRRPQAAPRTTARMGASQTHNETVRRRAPPAPPTPPEDQPVGWDSFHQHVREDRVVRNERFDVFAEISGLIGDQIVTQALNSTLADVLENHLQNRMQAAPFVFTRQAREESMRTLNNLPRRQRARNDFSDIGIIEMPTTTNRPRFAPTTNRDTRRESARSSRGYDRVDRLEQMIESMQSLLTRQSNSQTQLESAVQQILLNQTLLSSNATGINISMTPETAGRCVVCLDESRPVDSAFYRCGHVIACTPCAAVLLAVNPYCPLCRQKIDDVIKLYKLT